MSLGLVRKLSRKKVVLKLEETSFCVSESKTCLRGPSGPLACICSSIVWGWRQPAVANRSVRVSTAESSTIQSLEEEL